MCVRVYYTIDIDKLKEFDDSYFNLSSLYVNVCFRLKSSSAVSMLQLAAVQQLQRCTTATSYLYALCIINLAVARGAKIK